ncbi:hypothetical protein [Cupriavidus sp. D39]|uniref:hypothetical protein n=1 Tax=Cupriavidus sp. D39 TaxID=2997877 RepID=UPI00226F062C|nr:hypothetical protein [Cupriavidus sp. D39]MCY0853794.1 hypothetical protein [Cupriavidus sp. D39]
MPRPLWKQDFIRWLIALSPALLILSATAATDARPQIYVGFYKDRGMLVLYPNNPRTARIFLDGDFGENVTHISCGGHIETTAKRIGEDTYIAAEQSTDKYFSDQVCRLRIKVTGRRAIVSEESYGCALWRGACASFSGHARRVFP